MYTPMYTEHNGRPYMASVSVRDYRQAHLHTQRHMRRIVEMFPARTQIKLGCLVRI